MPGDAQITRNSAALLLCASCKVRAWPAHQTNKLMLKYVTGVQLLRRLLAVLGKSQRCRQAALSV